MVTAFSDITRYLEKRGRTRSLQGGYDQSRCYRNFVVIPACCESAYLPAALASLASNDVEQLQQTLIVVVVNNPPPESCANISAEDPAADIVTDNLHTLLWLQANHLQRHLNLAWIDASQPGLELPPGTGVGLARKLGMDSCLDLHVRSSQRTDAEEYTTPVIFCLDADTSVEPNYLKVADELRRRNISAGVIPFEHTASQAPELQRAIEWYELYLYYYVEGLTWADSPYAFHSIGSTIVCNGKAYVRAGGMPAKRLAGEDFYFLQQLAKTDGVSVLNGTVVHPSSRVSLRVPFGTGARLTAITNGEEAHDLVYDPKCFAILRELLMTVKQDWRKAPQELLKQLKPIELQHFLETRNFAHIVQQFQRQFPRQDAFMAAFNRWFDGLATLKLIHFLTAEKWPKREIVASFQQLRHLQGTCCTDTTVQSLLAWCRKKRNLSVL